MKYLPWEQAVSAESPGISDRRILESTKIYRRAVALPHVSKPQNYPSLPPIRVNTSSSGVYSLAKYMPKMCVYFGEISRNSRNLMRDTTLWMNGYRQKNKNIFNDFEKFQKFRSFLNVALVHATYKSSCWSRFSVSHAYCSTFIIDEFRSSCFKNVKNEQYSNAV